MSVVPKHKLTAQEYLAIERAAQFKSEFYDGEMFAMAGASIEHNRLRENFAIQLGMRLLKGPCESFSSDQRVRVKPSGLYTYPDIVVVCGPVEFDDERRDTITNPKILIEVLSPSTERYDRGVKFHHYKQIESLHEILLVSQSVIAVDQFVRMPDGSWRNTSWTQLTDTVRMSAIDATIPLSDIYRGVDLPPSLSIQTL